MIRSAWAQALAMACALAWSVPRPELLVEAPQGGQGAVEHGDLSSQAQGHGGGLGACHATAKNDHLASHDARYAAEQNAAAALGFCRHAAPTWMDMRPATSLMGSGGQGAFQTGYRFIGDGGDATGLERFRLGWVGGEVQVGKRFAPDESGQFRPAAAP